MPEEDKDVNATESSAVEEQDVEEVESSTTEDVEAESSTEEEVQQVPYERFKEVNEEKKYYQGLVQQLASRQQTGETAKEVEADPYVGMTAEELQFYRNSDKRTQTLIQKEAAKLAQPMKQQYDNLAKQVSHLITDNFRKTNTDIPPNSEEERLIAEKINGGYTLDDATWAVMGAKRVESAKTQKTVKQQKKIQEKSDANLETGGIQENSGIPSGEKLTFRQKVERDYNVAMGVTG